MNTQTLNTMTQEQVSELNSTLRQKASFLKEAYNLTREALGKDSAEAKAAWETYVKFDEDSNPVYVKWSQNMMQAQMDNMSDEEARNFNEINY